MYCSMRACAAMTESRVRGGDFLGSAIFAIELCSQFRICKYIKGVESLNSSDR
jgi:hypothetical protein